MYEPNYNNGYYYKQYYEIQRFTSELEFNQWFDDEKDNWMRLLHIFIQILLFLG